MENSTHLTGNSPCLDFAHIDPDKQREVLDQHIYYTLGGAPVSFYVLYDSTLHIDEDSLSELVEKTGYVLELENEQVIVK